jgi:peptidoglycan/LPS O-acetylase OafA/YrhL
VLVAHLGGTTYFPVGHGAVGALAALGIRIFFVISGYLITTLLLREHARTGTVSLGAFYRRRAFRLIPALAAFVVAIAIAAAFGAIRDLGWQLGHLWPLAVIAAFYLVWPVLLLAVGPRRLGDVAIAVLVASPVLPVSIGAIAAGAVFAAHADRIGSSLRYHRFLRSQRFLIVPALAIACALLVGAVAITIQSLAIALIVDRCVRCRGSVRRVLDARPVAFLGTISYSLYLWQQPFLDHASSTPLTTFPLNLSLALGFALAAYYLVERSFQTLARDKSRRHAAARQHGHGHRPAPP